MHLLGVVERDERPALARALFSGVVQLRHGAEAQLADGGVAGGGVEEGGKRARIAQRPNRPKHLQPGFLKQVPGIGFCRRQPPEVIKQRTLPEPDNAIERIRLSALKLGDQQFGLEDLAIWVQFDSLRSNLTQDAFNWEKVQPSKIVR